MSADWLTWFPSDPRFPTPQVVNLGSLPTRFAGFDRVVGRGYCKGGRGGGVSEDTTLVWEKFQTVSDERI